MHLPVVLTEACRSLIKKVQKGTFEGTRLSSQKLMKGMAKKKTSVFNNTTQLNKNFVQQLTDDDDDFVSNAPKQQAAPKNNKDCGVFVMRHMETYDEASLASWNSGLKPEGAGQDAQLDDLWKKSKKRAMGLYQPGQKWDNWSRPDKKDYYWLIPSIGFRHIRVFGMLSNCVLSKSRKRS
nr:ulp1 protease family, C-terminal catalytic domain-containing protein [Tanacetum cinerariifolium]